MGSRKNSQTSLKNETCMYKYGMKEQILIQKIKMTLSEMIITCVYVYVSY